MVVPSGRTATGCGLLPEGCDHPSNSRSNMNNHSILLPAFESKGLKVNTSSENRITIGDPLVGRALRAALEFIHLFQLGRTCALRVRVQQVYRITAS